MSQNKSITSIKSNLTENISHLSKIILLFFGGLLFLKIYYDLSNGVHIFGDKNNSFFDVWSLEHIITGMSMSYFFLLFNGPFSKAMKKHTIHQLKTIQASKNKYSHAQIKEIQNILQNKDTENKIIHHSLIVISIALAWEIIEHYMETTSFKTYGIELYFHNAQIWFSGVEIFTNRFFVDVFLVYLGWYFVRQRPTLSEIAAPISLLWLLTHILVFKDSMFLHKHSFEETLHKLLSLDMLIVMLLTILITLIMTLIKNSMRKRTEF